MNFYQLDVFAEAPYRGNPLAVLPEVSDLTTEQMQQIASEMNLSETTFVTSVEGSRYDVRIFTPAEELPFAGHPTIGTAWLLRHLGRLTDGLVTQRSPAGDTQVDLGDDRVWFTRSGESDADLEDRDLASTRKVARALGLEIEEIGLEARELGRPGRLMPAFADVGLRHLLVPVRDLDALGRVRASAPELTALGAPGTYCFSGIGAGRVQARGLFPAIGVHEDPATGSAAACMGIYLAARFGEIELEVLQGIEMGRASSISVRARPGEVSVGGRCRLVLSGVIESLP